MNYLSTQLACLMCLLSACADPSPKAPQQENDDIQPVSGEYWQEAVVSVSSLDKTAQFFTQIGGYDELSRAALTRSELEYWGLDADVSGESLLLAPEGSPSGHVRLIEFAGTGKRRPMRPGARAWDTGCFASLMVRAKGLDKIYDDAIALGWWSETPLTDLTFGDSELQTIVFRGPDGVQVQAYERFSPPLPDEIPKFERLTRPFNIMKMVESKARSHDFFVNVLGFGTWYNGQPYVSQKPTFMPLGIPINLTTEIPYQAAMVHAKPGEFGRIEMIEIMGLDGRDHSAHCIAPNLGILSVRFEVDDAEEAAATILRRGGQIDTPVQTVDIDSLGRVKLFNIKSPDGEILEFFQRLN